MRIKPPNHGKAVSKIGGKKMVANISTQRATLKDLQTDFSLAFLKGVTLSLKSRQNGSSLLMKATTTTSRCL